MPVTAKGLEGIVANSTRLSDVRGDVGQLIYAGYDINELAGKVSFCEVIYLLYNGRLPTLRELGQFEGKLRHLRELPKGVVDFLQAAPKDAVPMDVIRTAVSMLGLYDKGTPDESGLDKNQIMRRCLDVTAKIGVIAAYYHRARKGKSLPPVRSDLTEAEHFLYLLNGEVPAKEAAATLDMAFVLHADHGMNASTFSARVTIATLTDVYSAVTAAIATLKGPLHGGANEGVIAMLKEIGSEDNVIPWLEDQLGKKKKIMGMGHRVYKVLDPRAPLLRDVAQKMTEQLGEAKWLRMSEKIAGYMKEKKDLNANVDFYSATVYYSLGLPTDYFTPVFAISRTAGWTAHILEQLEDNRLYRPLSEYTGPEVGLTVTPVEQRQ